MIGRVPPVRNTCVFSVDLLDKAVKRACLLFFEPVTGFLEGEHSSLRTMTVGATLV